jgi:hypothetical protein
MPTLGNACFYRLGTLANVTVKRVPKTMENVYTDNVYIDNVYIRMPPAMSESLHNSASGSAS